MPGLINLDMTKRIVMDSFYKEIEASKNERIHPKIAEEIPQETTTVSRPGFGAVPKPIQLSGTTAGSNVAQSRSVKDYQYTTKVVEWDLTVDLPRSTVEDLPDEAATISRNLAASGTVFMDEQAVAQLNGAETGYDGKVLYSGTHNESGSNQDNDLALGGDNQTDAADFEAAMGAITTALRGFTDDQRRPVNEGFTKYLVLVNPKSERAANLTLNPTLAGQAIDTSGVTGVFRGQAEIVTSAYVADKEMFVFAVNRTRKALGLYMKTPWQFTSNIGTESDAWNYGRTALFSGYARFQVLPRDWKVTCKYSFAA